MFKLFSNGLVLQSDMTFKTCSILLQDEIIYELLEPGAVSDKPIESEVDLEGQLVFPGLINAHDHLIDTCWQPLGETPTTDWYTWDLSLKNTEDYKLLQRLSVTDLYITGMYKNAISGVTTVVDLFPAEVAGTFYNHSLLTLLQHFYLAHSFSSRQLKWGTNLIEQFKQARGILPFIIHAGEGSSKEIAEELEQLNRLGILEKNTVIINGTFLEDNDLQLIADRKSSMVWLPTSSNRIFARQPNIKKILDLGIRLTIGTDSSITGSGYLLDELKAVCAYSKEYLNGAISAKDAVDMVTRRSAQIFGIEKSKGSIAAGKMADFIVFQPQKDRDPFETFVNYRVEDFSMVVHKGRMIIGNDEFRKISSVDFSQYSEVRLNDASKLLFGQPIQLLERIRHKVGKDVVFPFFNIADKE